MMQAAQLGIVPPPSEVPTRPTPHATARHTPRATRYSTARHSIARQHANTLARARPSPRSPLASLSPPPPPPPSPSSHPLLTAARRRRLIATAAAGRPQPRRGRPRVPLRHRTHDAQARRRLARRGARARARRHAVLVCRMLRGDGSLDSTTEAEQPASGGCKPQHADQSSLLSNKPHLLPAHAVRALPLPRDNSRDCAAICDAHKQFQDAAKLYVEGEQPDRAAAIYIRTKNWCSVARDPRRCRLGDLPPPHVAHRDAPPPPPPALQDGGGAADGADLEPQAPWRVRQGKGGRRALRGGGRRVRARRRPRVARAAPPREAAEAAEGLCARARVALDAGGAARRQVLPGRRRPPRRYAALELSPSVPQSLDWQTSRLLRLRLRRCSPGCPPPPPTHHPHPLTPSPVPPSAPPPPPSPPTCRNQQPSSS